MLNSALRRLRRALLRSLERPFLSVGAVPRVVATSTAGRSGTASGITGLVCQLPARTLLCRGGSRCFSIARGRWRGLSRCCFTDQPFARVLALLGPTSLLRAWLGLVIQLSEWQNITRKPADILSGHQDMAAGRRGRPASSFFAQNVAQQAVHRTYREKPVPVERLHADRERRRKVKGRSSVSVPVEELEVDPVPLSPLEKMLHGQQLKVMVPHLIVGNDDGGAVAGGAQHASI